MPLPPIPPPIETLGNRPFSFYPPILNTIHNEWHFRRATWSEVLVINAKSNEEIWIPRRFLGEISSIDEPVVIVGLTKELEYVAGQVLPHVRRIIEMPRAVNEGVAPVAAPRPAPSRPAPVVGIKLENTAESRVGRMIMSVMAIGIVSCIAVVTVFVFTKDSSHVVYKSVEQANLGLSANDDYYAVVRKLGPPAEDHWRAGAGAMKFRLLSYPSRDVFIVLMGSEESSAHYIGTFDTAWHVVDSVTLPGGGSTQPMMRSLKHF